MKKLTIMLAALAMAYTANANPILGSVTIAGGASLNGPLATATQVDAWSALSVSSVDGDFDTFINVGDVPTMSAPLVFNPSTPKSGLWNAGGFQFDLAASTIVLQTSGFLVISGLGQVTGNGMDATPGVWNFSTQSPSANGVFSFSASTDTQPPRPQVPDAGTSVTLLGLGLLGLGLVRRKLA